MKQKQKQKINIAGYLMGRTLMTLLIACAVLLVFAAGCFAVTVTLNWGASSGSTGYKVYYQADSTTLPFKGTGATEGSSPIDVGNRTSATISGLDPAHSYHFAVTAYNSAGESPYSNLVSIPELTSPTTSISYPADKSTVGGTVAITASASDNIGVSKVEFYVNGALKGTDTSNPYTYSWNTSSLTAGSYTLMTKAYDAAGNVGQSGNVVVTVVKDTTAPTVSLTSPSTGATLSGTVTIAATASDAVGVSKVEFYANGSLLSASNVAPYSYNWNTTSVSNGSYALLAKAYDATGNVGQSSQRSVTVSNTTTSTPSTTPTTGTPSSSTTTPPTITTASLAAATVGSAYSATLGASGGVSPYTWKLSAGVLPPGLSLTSTTGKITGTPSASGTYSATLRVTDSKGATATRALSITVNNSAPRITTSSLASATVGKAYSATLAASGGVSPYTWKLSSGVLPPGLSLGSTTGKIAGTPTTSGTYSVTFRVTDSKGVTATRSLTIKVNAAPVAAAPLVINTSTMTATAAKYYSTTLSASGGVAPYLWRIATSSLPFGMSLNGSTGQLGIYPSNAGTYLVSFQVTDSKGATTTKTVTISVKAY